MRAWLAEGLIDILAAGGPPFDLDRQEVRRLTLEADGQLFSRIIRNPALLASPEENASRIADDIVAAAEDGTLNQVVLTVRLSNFCAENGQLVFDLNGEPSPNMRSWTRSRSAV